MLPSFLYGGFLEHFSQSLKNSKDLSNKLISLFEIEVSQKVYTYLESLIQQLEFCNEEDEILDYKDDAFNYCYYDDEDDDDYVDDGESGVAKGEVSLEYMRQVVEYKKKFPKHSFTTIQKKFRYLSS